MVKKIFFALDHDNFFFFMPKNHACKEIDILSRDVQAQGPQKWLFLRFLYFYTIESSF